MNTCIYCGKPIHTQEIIVHIIPLFTAKWASFDNDVYAEFAEDLHSDINKGCAHTSCRNKVATIVPDIDSLYISEESKDFLRPLAERLKYAAEDNTETIRKLQDYKCSICEGYLGFNYILRRLDNNKPRSFENAICIHGRCNKQFNRFYR